MSRNTREDTSEPRSRRFYDLLGLSLFFVGAACLLWLTWSDSAVVPDLATRVLRTTAGSAAVVVPVLLMFIGSMFLVGYDQFSCTHVTWGSVLAFLTFVTWRHVGASATALPLGGVAAGPFGIEVSDPKWTAAYLEAAGGILGGLVGSGFLWLFGLKASHLFLVMLACMSVVLIVDRPFVELLRTLRKPADAGVVAGKKAVKVVQARRAAKAIAAPDEIGLDDEPVRLPAAAPVQVDTSEGMIGVIRKRVSGAKAGAKDAEVDEAPFDQASPPAKPRTSARAAVPPAGGSPSYVPYQLPPLSLLKEAPPFSNKRMQQEQAERVQIIEKTLQDFDIGAKVVTISQGPTITCYELQVAAGIKVGRVSDLADTLAYSLKAEQVRIEAPIPGKQAIGIEVPNNNRAIVSLRECLESPAFRNAPTKLHFALGKDASGDYRMADLTKMPHMLVAGATNAGKSVCLNALIASIVYRAQPEEVKFLMIDPKKVELSLWDGIPHLLHPVVKEAKQTAGIFRAVLREMDKRYDLFSQTGSRNITSYNEKVPEGERMPYIVVIVDELADLMMQVGAEIETSIARLAQLARATGIHLVIATQRPSVDVITGKIKANIPSRIAFMCSQQVDSRTIIDQSGAERLIGRGDMLFQPIDAPRPVRIQGCYMSEEETHAVVNYLKEQDTPDYTMQPIEEQTEESSEWEGGAIGGDSLFEKAVRLVVMNGQASASMLQRRFKIGYARAGRLVDEMEQGGLIGPADGAKPREILVTRDDVERMFRKG